MGKRKRRADLKKTPPLDLLPPSPGMDAFSKQHKFSHHADSSGIKTFSTIADIIDGPVKVTQGQQSSIVHRRNIDHAMSLRHHRHYYGRHYSRRRSASNAEASTSHGGTTPFYDGKLSLKLASYLDSGNDTENRQRAVQKPERVASSSLAMSMISSDARKLYCGLCQQFLRTKPYAFDNSMPSIHAIEPSVVAVLGCGHLYHADCLEQRTNHEDRQDPPCPICLGLLSQVQASVEQD